MRDSSLCGAWWAQVPQRDVRHEVEELEEDEKACEGVEHGGCSPFWRRVVWTDVEVHRCEAKEHVVVEAVLEDVDQRHSLAREAMHKKSLQLSLDVVKQGHEDAQLLIQFELWILTVDGLSKYQEKDCTNDWACVLNIEDCIPADLRTEILEIECHCRLLNVLTQLFSHV